MSTTKIKFSPSINIQRDNEYDFDYIATPNSSKVFNQVLSDSLVGVKSHVVIGAYGTGKSSLLLATKQTLSGRKRHFEGNDKLIKQLPDFEFVPIVGTYSSLTEQFAQLLNIQQKDYSTNDVIKGLDKYYQKLQKKGKGLAFLIDEFGKFLEYAAKQNPEAELYFIQQLAEWINSSDHQTLLITTLHQDFNATLFLLTRVSSKNGKK
jgi:Cdc6-like AAA superfamily ATPase